MDPSRIKSALSGRTYRHCSEILSDFLDEADQDDPRLEDLLAAFGDRAFGAVMLLFAVPNLLPLPPGASAVLGLPLILIAGQLALGWQTLWLPRALTRRALPRGMLIALSDRALPTLRRVERVLKPRAGFLLGPVGDRVIGAACLVMAIVLFLPIPFANLLPALAIAGFALGLIEKDGLAVMAGWLLVAVSAVVVYLILGAMVIAAEVFFRALLRPDTL